MSTRRRFLQYAGLGAAFAAGAVRAEEPKSQEKNTPPNPVKGSIEPIVRSNLTLGVASYSFRKFPLDKTLAMTQRLGIKHICLKDFHLPLKSTPEEIDRIVDQVKAAGLELYAVGVIAMAKQADVDRAFEYAERAGAKIIVGVPVQELLTAVEEKAKKHDISVAIHNHGPGDRFYPTPDVAYGRIQKLDRRIGLCIDVGHAVRSGINPAHAVEQYADRLLDVHIKDVSAIAANGQTVVAGHGVIDTPELLRALMKIRYPGVLAFEYEKDPDDPLPGLAESVGYIRGALAAM
jgi:inosose dehydratase